ncbi:MAG: diguanylate cyclase [Clostridia bacterium]|nr:diguanylate cyclase [Clostridia bacterium]
MDLNITTYNHYRTEMKFKITLVYSIVSLLACVMYAISFIAIGANIAAFVMMVGGFIFTTVVGLLRRGITLFTRYIAILTSMSLVFIQSVFFFGKDFGFHFQLFPLLVVIFLLMDFTLIFERYSIYILTLMSLLLFFFCDTVFFDSLSISYAKYAGFHYAMVIIISFGGMLVLLYYLSSEMFSTKDMLYNMATVDMLTELYNRRTFIKRGEEFFKIASRGGNGFSVIIFDVDSFKSVNDEYGHIVGDKVLKELSALARSLVRETDVIGRYGGEEFAILLPNTNAEQAAIVAEKLRFEIEKYEVHVQPYKINRTISLGIMAFDLKISSFSDMMDKADKAMYKSKSSGKNMITIFDGSDMFYKEKRVVYELDR